MDREGRRIEALIKLLGDESVDIAARARRELEAMGEGILDALQMAERHDDPRIRVQARNLIRDIRTDAAERVFVAWATDSSPDLEEGLFLLARLVYPELLVGLYRDQLDAMADELSVSLRGRRRAERKVWEFHHYLFEKQGFRGVSAECADLQKLLINRVIDRRLGTPESLGTIFLLLGNRLGLPMHGIGMPGSFLVRLVGEEGEVYIDPLRSHEILSRSECVRAVLPPDSEFSDAYLIPSRTREIVAQILVHLAHTEERRGEKTRSRRFERCLGALRHEPSA